MVNGLNGIGRLLRPMAHRGLAIPRLELRKALPSGKAFNEALIFWNAHFGHFSSRLRQSHPAVNLNRKKSLFGDKVFSPTNAHGPVPAGNGRARNAIPRVAFSRVAFSR